MTRTVLLTGATDGIGLELARKLAAEGHDLLLHGRNRTKLNSVVASLSELSKDGRVTPYVADLSDLAAVDAMADAIADAHSRVDVLINNAGVFKTDSPVTPAGLDIRFVVNTLAPYRLTTRLMPLMKAGSRVVNLSSAAQAPVDLEALAGRTMLSDDFSAYAQSKLALTMWSRTLGLSIGTDGPVVVAVNPGSLLGTKMVKQGFGMAGNDINIGVDILHRAAFSDEFASASGQYFDNDSGQFAAPHPDALDDRKAASVTRMIAAMAETASASRV